MTSLLAAAFLLMQAAPAPPPQPPPEPPDSAELAHVGKRLEGQDEARIRVGRDLVELAQPRLLDTVLAYRAAWFDRIDRGRPQLANPLPMSEVSAIQVRGHKVWPSVLAGSLGLGISALASAGLTGLINPSTGPDGGEILNVTLLGFGVGAVAGGINGLLVSRWLTIYQRGEVGEPDWERERGPRRRP